MGSYSRFIIFLFFLFIGSLFAAEEPFPQLTAQETEAIQKELVQEIKKLQKEGSLQFVIAEEDVQRVERVICRNPGVCKKCYPNALKQMLKTTLKQLLEILNLEVSIYASLARASTTLKEIEGSDVVLRFYEKRQRKTIDPNLKVILLKEDLGEAANELPTAVTGVAVGSFELEKKYEIDVRAAHHRTAEVINLTANVSVKGYSLLAKWLINRIFKVDSFIVLFSHYFGRSREMRFIILVHELQHILDQTSELHKTYNYWDHRKKLAEKLEKEGLIEKDYQEVIKTKEYLLFFEWFVQNQKTDDLDETKTREFITKAYKDEFSAVMKARFLYLYDPIEKRGFLEEVRFCTDKEYGLGFSWDQMQAFYNAEGNAMQRQLSAGQVQSKKSVDKSQPPTQQDASGQPELPDLPLEKRYLREIFDETRGSKLR